MINIKTMPLNALQVNTYIVWDDTKDAIIIDPACETEAEQQRLSDFIKQQELRVTHILLTHAHIDHLVGAAFVSKTYQLPVELHQDSRLIFPMLGSSAASIGMSLPEIPGNLRWLEDGDKISFGQHEMRVLHTPGHADGSLCYVLDEEKTVFTGDVLFYQSIGRTDLMTGDFDKLKNSIYQKLFTLGDDYTARPGHGARTSIEFERNNNPFL